jgi:hypothetical protein
MDDFLKRFGDFANKQGATWRLDNPELMDSYQAACEHYNRKFNVGPLTMKRVFEAHGMVNMYDFQRVLDAMEAALDTALKFASNAETYGAQGGYNLGVEEAATKVDAVWRRRRGVMNCTELCAEIRSLLKTGNDVPEYVKVVPVPQAIKDEAEKATLLEELLPAPEPFPTGTAPHPESFDWHYVDCHRNVEHGHRLVGWFPTKFLASRHCLSWPSSVRDYMVVKPRSVAPQGTELHFPQQAASDVLRETNECLATCGIAKVGLGELYFPDKAVFGKPTSGNVTIGEIKRELTKDMMPPPDQRWLSVTGWKFAAGDRVRKRSGAWWEGKVVGFYSTYDTPRGYAVQLQTRNDNGPVQIYPESALELNP